MIPLQSCQRMAPCADFCFDSCGSCAIRWIWAHSTTHGRTVNRNMCLLLSSLCQSYHQLPGGKTIKTYTQHIKINFFVLSSSTPERFVRSLIGSGRFFESPFAMSVIQTSPTVLTIVWLAYSAMQHLQCFQ